MIRREFSLLFFLILILPFECYPKSLKEGFINPSDESRTKVWWFHGETETTKEGIDADLKAFKEAGIGGVVFYDQTHSNQEGAFPSLSPQWWDMLKYAALKAKEYGLSFEMAVSNGYVAGGPWITPDLGMKWITVLRPEDVEPANFIELLTLSIPAQNKEYVDTVIQKERISASDNEGFYITTDLGSTKEIRTISYTVSPRGKGAFSSMNIPGNPSEEFFGAKYTKMPPIGDLEYSLDGENWEKAVTLKGVESVIGHKSKQRTINFPPVTGRYFRVNIHDWLGNAEGFNKIFIENIRLSSFDLIDNWEEKSGLRSEISYPDSRIPSNNDFVPFFGEMRIGYAPNGAYTKHGRSKIIYDGQELESKTWLETDIMSAKAAKHHYDNYFKLVYDTLANIGCQPVGMVMDSHEAGAANWTQDMPSHFKRLRGYDIEPWLPVLGGVIVGTREESEKFLKDFKLTISEVIAQQFYGTFADLCSRDNVIFTSQAMLGCANDNIFSRGMAHKPQGEFWAYQTNGNYDCLDAASAAHLFGKQIASGEAFTDTPYFEMDAPDWKEQGWAKLLRIANLAYCKGINEFAVCASSYQPWMDKKYDDDESLHPYIFHRLNPAWDISREHFWDYQARCSEMLRNGKPVVDILVYLGEDLPAKTLTYKLPVIPEGFNFDVATISSLKIWMNNKTAFSPEYKIVVVEKGSLISEESENLINRLKEEGINIVRADKGESVEEVIKSMGILPDIFIESDNTPGSKVYFTHRTTGEEDIYFVYNHSAAPYNGELRFRNGNENMEMFDPKTTETYSYDASTLNLEPYQSLFIITK